MYPKIRTITILLIVAAVFGCSANAWGQDVNIRPDQQAILANEALDRTLDKGGPVASWIATLLNKENYSRLENAYMDVEQLYEEDVLWESYLLAAYQIFHPSNKDISLEALNKWVEERGSHVAYAARGIYLAQAAGRARGGRYISQTPKENLEIMAELCQEAAKDLLVAVDKNPRLSPAYMYLVIMAKMTPMPYTGREIVDRCWADDKRSYYVPVNYLSSLEPRCGGSYAQMAEFIEEAVQYAPLNPRLWTLQGEIDADRAALQWEQGNFNYSAELYTSAMQYGERVSWLRYRAACYYKLGKYKEALDDFQQVLVYEPRNKQAREWVPWLMANVRKAQNGG
ncbi:MAG: tetratricopeptide repeat protein [Candidatus Zixiibacteriota bacterium]|nr:MAG: tetratricopeptide repeat protein [candidate division Zixibacteria bacterium]